MKKMFSILVVLISLISTNFVYAGDTQTSYEDVITESVVWNFKVYQVIQSTGTEGDNVEFDMLTNSLKEPAHEMYVNFEGTPNAPITMTTTGNSGNVNLSGGASGNGITLNVTVNKMNAFDSSGEAWCKIIINSITSGATTGQFIYTNTVTVEYQ